MVQSLAGETWKQVPGYEGLYEVSNLGRVKSLGRPRCLRGGRILKQQDNGFGYLLCQLCKAGKRRMASTHRLVAAAFIPNPDDKPQVNHKDGCKHNNRADNLEWCTNSENQLHKFRVLGCKSYGGPKKHKVICCETGVVYASAYDAQRATGIRRANISNVAFHRYGFRTAGGYHWEFMV